MFNLYTGIPGSGKTLLAVKYDLWPLLEQGRQVYSNTWINWKGNNLHYFVDPVDLITLRDAVIFIDEIGSILDSRNWKETPPEVRYFLQQHRKRNIDIIATTQHPSFVEISARAIIGYWAKCYNLTPTEGLKGRRGIGSHLPFLLIQENPIDIDTITQEIPQEINTNFISKVGNIKVFVKDSMFYKRYQRNKIEPLSAIYDTKREIALTNKKHFYRPVYKCKECGKEHPYRHTRSDREIALTQELQKIADEYHP